MQLLYRLRQVALALAVLLGLSSAHAEDLRFAAGVISSDFSVTCFARDLPFPYGMALLPDGSLLVGLSIPREGGGIFQSIGELRRFADSDGDGVAELPGISVATNLPGVLVDVRIARDLIFVVSAEFGNEQILCFRQGLTPSAPLLSLGHIRIDYPWVYHQTYGLAIRAAPGTPSDLELFFNVGSLENDLHRTNQLALSGLTGGSVPVETVCAVTIQDRGDHLDVSEPRVIATGLRNAAGLTFDPITGDLYAADNGIDIPPNGSLSADELNVIRREDIGTVVPDFGYPDTYVPLDGSGIVGSRGVAPYVAFLPSAGGVESEGVTQITVAPTQFPTNWNQGLLVAFHGTYDHFGTNNDETAVVYVDPKTRRYQPLIAGAQASVGHLDGVLATDRALYVADFSGRASIFTQNVHGAIYRITPSQRPVGCGVGGSRPVLSLKGNGNVVTRGAAVEVEFQWSDDWSSCQLEYREALSQSTPWLPVTETVTVQAGTRTVHLAPPAGERWFRLNCTGCP